MISLVITGYEIGVIVIVLGGWLPLLARRRPFRRLLNALEWQLSPLRRLLPLRGWGVDFSPCLLVLLLEVARTAAQH